eukprot:Skav218184  [mRNA]  locus=scaffold5213:224637:229939:- [translate_table: standard]
MLLYCASTLWKETCSSYAWGVTWPGKCDKWGKEEAPIVDWDEVKQAFGMWKNFAPYNPFQYMGGMFAVMKEATQMFFSETAAAQNM